LIELLVTVVIVVTLAGVAVLGARGALTASRQAASTTNLRNIGVALRMHADEHNGTYPQTTHSTSVGKAWIYALEAYLGSFDETRICPADPLGRERREAKGSSYILNSYIFVPRVGPFGNAIGPQLNRVNAIPHPERTLLAFVCSDRTGVGRGNDHTHSHLWKSWSAVCADIAPDRFGGGSKDQSKGRSLYLHADGRVEAWNAAEVRRRIERGDNIAKPPGIEGLP
jgi:hypothetical protein